jgi:repressor LexA
MRTKPNPIRARGTRPPSRTPSTEAILAYIEESLRDTGRPPTIREIGAAFGIASTNGVRYHLDKLEREGKIHRDRFTSRGLGIPLAGGRGATHMDTLPSMSPAFRRANAAGGMPGSAGAPAGRDLFEIPLLGRVAAGAPLLAEEHVEDTITLDSTLVRGGGKHFALRVRGDSMKNAGILDGDIVIVRHDSPVKSGEIAVVLIGDEATVKRFFPRRDKLLLFPENEDYEPIEVRPADPEVRVAGKVVGVFRRLS